MSTRVTSAASKRAKATLVELLFPRQQAKRYSHLQLRTAYLQKLHIMHPDKHRSSSFRDEKAHRKFVQLQNAWEAYNISARMFRQSGNSKRHDDEEDNNNDFTMFGVGCSFSDSPEERKLRDEIMDQACRGWLPSGALSHSDGEKKIDEAKFRSPQQSFTKLSDDEMFMQQQTLETSTGSINIHNDQPKKCLVQNVENYRNRIRRTR